MPVYVYGGTFRGAVLQRLRLAEKQGMSTENVRSAFPEFRIDDGEVEYHLKILEEEGKVRRESDRWFMPSRKSNRFSEEADD